METRSTHQVSPYFEENNIIFSCPYIQINMGTQAAHKFAGADIPTLVIRQVLTSNEEEEEGWRQQNFFRTRVRVEEKVANLVIDRGSGINFVVQEVIDKLHWPTKTLLKPYKVTWPNGFVISVTHVFGSFKLGNFEDNCW